MIAVIVIGVSAWLFAEKLNIQKESNQTNTLTSETADIPGLPPDPGEAGKKTLEGIDSDHDGVRDDVQRWIALSYRNGSQKQEAALRQMAIAYQRHIGGDESHQQLHDAADCVSFVFMSSAKDVAGGRRSYDAKGAINAVILNTYARTRAYLKFESSAIVDSTPYSSLRNKCTFDPEMLPN